MAKLHELLAVEGDLSKVASKTQTEAINTFLKKPSHFKGSVRTVEMFDEGRSGENSSDETHMVTTIGDKLNYINRSAVKYYDAVLQKEMTNQKAKADYIVDGEVIAKDLPATYLLGLEQKLKSLRNVYESIPTLDPSLSWEKSETQGDGVYSADSKTNFRTEKVARHRVLVEATKEHPAQIREWFEDVAVGRIDVKNYSGMISVAYKSKMLSRIDTLILEAKRARQRANSETVVDAKLGQTLMDYIIG